MSKLGEQLFYDIESLYIEGLSAKAIAKELNCPLELVLEQLEELGVSDSPEACYVMDCDPYSTINS